MTDKALHKVVIGALIGAAASCIAVTLIALVLFPLAERTEHFWSRLTWVNILTLVAWLGLGLFFSQLSRRVRQAEGLGGILPSVSIYLLYYAASGYIGLLLVSFVDIEEKWQVAGSIYNVAGLILTLVLLYFSWIGATEDTEGPAPGVLPPVQLAGELRLAEVRLHDQQGGVPGTLAQRIGDLREFIQYALPNVGPHAQSSEYARFAAAVLSFLDDFNEAIDGRNAPDLSRLADRARSLRQQAASLPIRSNRIPTSIKGKEYHGQN